MSEPLSSSSPNVRSFVFVLCICLGALGVSTCGVSCVLVRILRRPVAPLAAVRDGGRVRDHGGDLDARADPPVEARADVPRDNARDVALRVEFRPDARHPRPHEEPHFDAGLIVNRPDSGRGVEVPTDLTRQIREVEAALCACEGVPATLTFVFGDTGNLKEVRGQDGETLGEQTLRCVSNAVSGRLLHRRGVGARPVPYPMRCRAR